MLNNSLWSVVLFWGVWLLIPLVVDGGTTLWHVLLSFRLRRQPPPVPAGPLPKVSVIIPAYNEQLNIDHCLLSLKAQTYPQHLIEIVVVDDGSADRTSDAVLGHMGSGQAG